MRWMWEYLRGVSVLLGDVAVFALIFSLVPAVFPSQSFSVALGWWCLYACVLFLVDEYLAGAGISMNLYLLLNAAGILAGSFLVVCRSVSVPHQEAFFLCLGAAAGGTGIHGAICGYRLPRSDGILRYVDVLIVLTGFYLYAVFQGRGELDQGAVGFGAAVFALDLVTVNHLRISDEAPSVIRGTGVGSRVILAGLFAASFAVTVFLVGAASGQVRSAADVLLLIMGFVLRGLEAFFTAVGWILGRIILFFLWLFPATSPQVRENIQENLGFQPDETAEAGFQLPSWVLTVLAVVILLGALVWVLYQLRHVKLRRSRAPSRKKKVARKSYVLEELLALGRRIWDWIIFEGRYRLSWNTPEGVFVYAQRMGRRKGIRRRKEETPGEYLRHLARRLEEKRQTEKADDLYWLAERLDQIFYGGDGRGGEKEMSRSQCKRCREQIRRACFVSFLPNKERNNVRMPNMRRKLKI